MVSFAVRPSMSTIALLSLIVTAGLPRAGVAQATADADAALDRIVDSIVEARTASTEPPLRQTERLVELADWDLRFGERTLAFDLYAETYSYLEMQDFARERIDAIFAPVSPVVLPKFLPDMLAPERAQGATGYVDVEFDVTRFGSTRRIKVLDRHNASRAAEIKIGRWLVENRFRPKVTDEGAVDARFVARHYVHE